MQDELVLDGKTYVSSKRAAQITGYAQDYIGQLCRAGHADCRRINGLWHVTIESLELNKTATAEVRAQAFDQINKNQIGPDTARDTILMFSGEEYVSAREGAALTGYNQDYVTQLARGGKIKGRQVGNRWYVSKEELQDNKERNDALLAAVQAESVGITRPQQPQHESVYAPVGAHTYVPEPQNDLLPQISPKAASNIDFEEVSGPELVYEPPKTPITIRRSSLLPKLERSSSPMRRPKLPRRYALAGATLLLLLGVFYTLNNKNTSEKPINNESRQSENYKNNLQNWFTEALANQLADVLTYIRQ